MSGGVIFTHLLVPLLAGFFLLQTVPWLKYRFHRFDGSRLLLYYVSSGVILTIFGTILLPFAEAALQFIAQSRCASCAPALRTTWHLFADALKGFGVEQDSIIARSAVMGLLISLVAGSITWLIGLNKSVQRSAIRGLIRSNGNALEVLLDDAMRRGKLVLISMKSNKAYVGIIECTLDPTVTNKAIKLFPIFSGYRDKDTRSLVLTNDYSPFMDALELYRKRKEKSDNSNPSEDVIEIQVAGQQPRQIDGKTLEALAEDYGVVVPWTDIESATIWYLDMYECFRPATKKTKSPNKMGSKRSSHSSKLARRQRPVPA